MRLFVAAELPADVAGGLAAWCPEDDALRAVGLESLHVTLAFLGERPEGDAAPVGGLLESVARPIGGLTLDAARWLPKRRPRVLAVELGHAEALAALQADLVEALAEAIGFEPERRAFLPHVTVARVRHRPPDGDLPPLPAAAPFDVAAVTLFRSRLSPKGARYERLAHTRLGHP